MTRTAARLLIVGALTLGPLLNASAAEPADRPPNIVLIYADDLGYSDVGCFGAQGYTTPNIDRIAKEGVRFTDFYVAQAVCSASRTRPADRLLSQPARNPRCVGAGSKIGISDDERTIAQVLKPRGYATAIFGKWHLGHHPQFLPTRHGFDEYFGLPYSNDMWPNHPTNRTFPDLPLFDGEKVVATNPDQRNLTTWYTERAVRFIGRTRSGRSSSTSRTPCRTSRCTSPTSSPARPSGGSSAT